MGVDSSISLEQALFRTEAKADAAVKAANLVVISLKKFRTAAQTGNLRELLRTIENVDQAIIELSQKFTDAQRSWVFDEETYLSGRNFPSEILATAERVGVKIFEQDDRLYCYPFIIRILPNERNVLIDKIRERRLRPSILVNHLKKLQSKPVRFNYKSFLESLFFVYSKILVMRGKEIGSLVQLKEIYELLTSLPGLSRKYPRQEFSRDLFLLDQGEEKSTKDGWKVNLHPPTGRGRLSQIFSTVTREGQVKRYYGILFTKER